MLVVNDLHVTSFYHTPDSLVVYGDTSFAVRYEFRLDRMLLHLRGGGTITMSSQPLTARPIFGGTIATWGRWVANLSNGTRLLLQILRGGNTARWRPLTGGSWTQGEWNRDARTITFTWRPDSSTWVGSYDATGHQIIFEETAPGTGVAIFRRAFFRNEA
jgi:hypothetical protein